MDGSSLVDVSLLTKVALNSMVAYWGAAAAAVWALHDILITLDEEVERMWRRDRLFSPPSVAYFLCRYYGLFHLGYSAFVLSPVKHTVAMCAGWKVFEIFGVVFLSFLANGLLALRVNVFYQGNGIVRYLLWIMFPVGIIIQISFSVITARETGPLTPYPPDIPISGCIARPDPENGIGAWIVDIAYELICLALILFRYLNYHHTNDGTALHLARTFVRDAAIFCTTVCCANLANILLLFVVEPDSPLALLGFPWLVATFSISVSRTILSLRAAAQQRYSTSYNVSTHSEPVFAPGTVRPRTAVVTTTSALTTTEDSESESAGQDYNAIHPDGVLDITATRSERGGYRYRASHRFVVTKLKGRQSVSWHFSLASSSSCTV